MKLPAILLIIVAVGLAYAAGSYFTPAGSRSESATTVAATDSTATARSSTGARRSDATSSPDTGAIKAPTLKVLMSDPEMNSYSYHRTKEIIAFAESLGPADIPDVLQQLDKMPDSRKKMTTTYFLAMRWTEIDPEGALAWSQKSGGSRMGYYMRLQTQQMAYGGMAEHAVADARF